MMNMFVAGCSGSRACPDSLAARVLQEVLRCVERSDCASSVQDEDLVRTADEIEPATRHEQITAAQPTANEIQYEQSSTQAILPVVPFIYPPTSEGTYRWAMEMTVVSLKFSSITRSSSFAES
jgi:hypothetical protein